MSLNTAEDWFTAMWRQFNVHARERGLPISWVNHAGEWQ